MTASEGFVCLRRDLTLEPSLALAFRSFFLSLLTAGIIDRDHCSQLKRFDVFEIECSIPVRD